MYLAEIMVNHAGHALIQSRRIGFPRLPGATHTGSNGVRARARLRRISRGMHALVRASLRSDFTTTTHSETDMPDIVDRLELGADVRGMRARNGELVYIFV